MNIKYLSSKITAVLLILFVVVSLFGSSSLQVKATVIPEEEIEEYYKDKYADKYANVYYATHVQTYGWQNNVSNGEVSGTEGQAKRLEGIKIKVDTNCEGGIQYSVHCQTYGWLDFVSDYEMAGTTGEAKRLESIKIKLTGELARVYDVYYRVHRQTYGWSDWVKNGEECGTTGEGKRLEGIQIKLLKKTDRSLNPYAKLKYTTHVQSYGWLPYVSDGEMSGTSGESKRIEAIKIDVDTNLTGGIHYDVQCQTYGWLDLRGNGDVAGTSGQSKRLETINIYLTGELDDYYDVYYRVHVQSYGWLDWTKGSEYMKNCEGHGAAGSIGIGKRLEAIEIKLVAEEEDKPGNGGRCCITLNEVLEDHPYATEGIQKQIVDYACKYKGVPYVYGGNSLSEGTDCSGFVRLVYQKFGVQLPHNARLQADYGKTVAWKDLKAGDIIFYDFYNNDTSSGPSDGRIDHSAIYLGGNLVIEQMPGAGCIINIARVYYFNGGGPAVKAVRLIEY